MNEEQIQQYIRDNLRLNIVTIYGAYGISNTLKIQLILNDQVISEEYLT